MPQDNIVELQEVFRWRLSVNDSKVRINPDTQVARLDNRDGKAIYCDRFIIALLVFGIGFKDLHVTIREGEVATLTIKQIGNQTGGVDIGGFQEGRLTLVQLRYISGTGTIG